MDLPTYTNIWRIEKRLYKLYDLRLPMPLPINWIAVFTGITVPYIVLLIAVGLPFNHTLVWLYVLPPGVLTWLTTRPVIESKRLPELIESQARYLSEPRTWVRLAPLSEKDQMLLTARVWHSRRAARTTIPKTARKAADLTSDKATAGRLAKAANAAKTTAVASRATAPGQGGQREPGLAANSAPALTPRSVLRRATTTVTTAAAAPTPPGGRQRERAGAPRRSAKPERATTPPVFGLGPFANHRAPAPALPTMAPPVAQPVAESPAAPPVAESPAAPPVAESPAALPIPELAPPVPELARPVLAAPVSLLPNDTGTPGLEVSHDGPRQPPTASIAPAVAPPDAPATPMVTPAREQAPAPEQPAVAEQPAAPAPSLAPTPAPRVVVAPVTTPVTAPVPSIERALSAPSRDRTRTWTGKVKVVTGHGAAQGPGARDQEALDRNRARRPLDQPRRILVLGCTSGAGQTVTALMTASMLASLREHPVAAVDLHDGALASYRAPASWVEDLLNGQPPQHVTPNRPDGLRPSQPPKPPNPARLDIIASRQPLAQHDEIKLAVQLNRHYPLAVLDSGAAGLTRLLKVTDQLVLVAPASMDAAGALADTRDWLDNNGHAELAMQSVTVINGVSRRSLPDVEHAESIARGRSRAIVRVPWDDMLPVAATGPATLRPQTRVAYTALAGVLVAGMAAAPVRKKP